MIPIQRLSIVLAMLATIASAELQTRGDDAPEYPDHARVMVVRDASGAERPVKTVADWEIRRGHILANLQKAMGELPGADRRVPLDWKILETHKEDGYTRHKIDYQSEPGDRVPAWLAIPDGKPGQKFPAMLCLHQTVAIGKDESIGLGQKPALRYGVELARRGYVTISPDYPGYGEYKIDPYAMGYASGSMKAIWNNMRAVDLLCSLPEVDADRIGVIGHSLGGHNAIYTAVFDTRIKAIVSSCGFNAFPYYKGGNILGWTHEGYMPRLKNEYNLDLKRVPFDFPELIAALAPRPFFTNSPLHDDNYAVEGVRVCMDAAKPVYALYGAEADLKAVYPDAPHAFVDEARMESYKFLDEHLKP